MTKSKVPLWKKRVGKDTVICAYAQPAAGPGFANTPIILIVADGDGKLRRECIQPDEQTEGMYKLYAVCAAAHGSLMGEIGVS
jgi:hypothetical protein